jgi:hypothetical protein
MVDQGSNRGNIGYIQAFACERVGIFFDKAADLAPVADSPDDLVAFFKKLPAQLIAETAADSGD